jgi:hypothetical protein
MVIGDFFVSRTYFIVVLEEAVEKADLPSTASLLENDELSVGPLRTISVLLMVARLVRVDVRVGSWAPAGPPKPAGAADDVICTQV